MKANNYIDVISKLNDEIEENCIDLYKMGICFEYSSTYYVDNISFMGRNIYNTENDINVMTEKELEDILREKILILTNGLMKWQHYDGTEE